MTAILPHAPTAFPDQLAHFTLDGPSGLLEVVTDVPVADEMRQGTVIICHPHPPEGGTMTNKVVTMLERAMRESGLRTVRFNFRGVGVSQGEYDGGAGETHDLLAVAKWVAATRSDDQLWLAGFSFGSYVALMGAMHLDIKQIVSIAPPAGRWDFSAMRPPSCPWLVVQGEDDEVVDPQAVYDFVASMPEPPALVRMPETGHFFHRKLTDLRGAVRHGIKNNLPPLA